MYNLIKKIIYFGSFPLPLLGNSGSYLYYTYSIS
uniref:Uncharacterized protein n=1 Tax=Mammaliicoccus phage MSShimriz1 TaxID=3230127 RepID=A0AAU8GT33_9VIRU